MPNLSKLCLNVAISLAALPALSSLAHGRECASLNPQSGVLPSGSRPLVAEDLIGLRDIGPVVSADPTLRILSVSPDGQKVAFQLRQAQLSANTYCMGMMVVDIPTGQPKLVDQGGELTRMVQTLHGLADYPSSFVAVVTPQWSSDSRSLAYLRQDDGGIQVWTASVSGTTGRQVTKLPVSPDAFTWTQDDSGLVIASRPGLIAAREAIQAEGKRGYLYDDRYVPFVSSTPFPQDVPPVYQTVDIATGVVRAATAGEAARLSPSEIALPPSAGLRAQSLAGAWAWSQPKGASSVNVATTLKVRQGDFERVLCDAEACDRVRDLWWSIDGKALVYLNREGRDFSRLGVYRLGLKDRLPTRLLDTEDALIGCAIAGKELICAQETATQPRRIVAIDLKSGAVRVIFDPNPQWHSVRLGAVQRLRWTNAYGVSTFGDLVLPPGHQPGQKHPLIVVQYESRGFLRGGTGDEYPIQLYATEGFAVLSVQGPVSVSYLRGAATYADVNRLDRADWLDRRNVLSSLEAGVQSAVATGAIDSDRIGITGLSEGASSAQFALLNTALFKAAAVSTCCDESYVINVLDAPGGTPWFRKMGYPPLTGDHTAFWKDMSLRDNAATMATPLLMQISDGEYLGALESYAALREHDQPVELYVFPDEYHFKWQPQHRNAVYQRSIDWFDFWLRDRRDTDPAKAQQYQRWDAFKQPPSQSLSASPGT